MKKIITISIFMASTLMLFAGSAPEYDFSSTKALEQSVIKQGAKEGFSERATLDIYWKYNRELREANEPAVNAFLLKLAKEKLKNKSLTELMNEMKEQ